MSGRLHPILAGVLALAACGEPAPTEVQEPEPTGQEPLLIPMVEDNVRDDTLVIQVTFDLEDGTHLLVAGNQQETFEGLRLYHYRARPDSTMEVLARSSPGYDSWTMLPTCFRPGPGDDLLLLANFGERQSWGQKVMRLGPAGFTDLGFLDVALPEHEVLPDTTLLKLGNAGAVARVAGGWDDLRITFTGDSLFLYDDLRGSVDRTLASDRVTYRLRKGRVFLIVDGEEREVEPPA